MSEHKEGGFAQELPNTTYPYHDIEPRPRSPVDALKLRRQLILHMPPERPASPSVPTVDTKAMNDTTDGNGWPRPDWVSHVYNNIPQFDEYDDIEGLDASCHPAVLAKIARCAFLEWKRLTSSLARLRDELGFFKRNNHPPSPKNARLIRSQEQDRVVLSLHQWDDLEKKRVVEKEERKKAERKGKGRDWRKRMKDDEEKEEEREGVDRLGDVQDFALYIKIAKEKILVVEEELKEAWKLELDGKSGSEAGGEKTAASELSGSKEGYLGSGGGRTATEAETSGLHQKSLGSEDGGETATGEGISGSIENNLGSEDSGETAAGIEIPGSNVVNARQMMLGKEELQEIRSPAQTRGFWSVVLME
ncbi:MAG: hypothetical protein Q9174_002660 [Haloplaca sp. 1 TL-2023]